MRAAIDEVRLEIAEKGLLVGRTASEVRADLERFQRDFDQLCQGVPLLQPSRVTWDCAVAGSWKGLQQEKILYDPDPQDQVWANQFDDIIDKYCKPDQ